VNTLLDFSRIEAGRLQAHQEPADLAALTADIASVFRVDDRERRPDASPSTARPSRSRSRVDREMWEKVVLNLLSNAFKFTLDGAIAISLRARRR
jgi:signal transduction histidine kinase